MVLRSKRDYLESIRQRYRQAPRKMKGHYSFLTCLIGDRG
jgi:hypothetical protein